MGGEQVTHFLLFYFYYEKRTFHEPQKLDILVIRLIHWSFLFRAMPVFVASPSPQKVWSVPLRWVVNVGGRGLRKDPTTRTWARKRRRNEDLRKGRKTRRKRLKVQRLVQRPAGQVGTRKVSSTRWMSQHDWLTLHSLDHTTLRLWLCSQNWYMVQIYGKTLNLLKMKIVSFTHPHCCSILVWLTFFCWIQKDTFLLRLTQVGYGLEQ